MFIYSIFNHITPNCDIFYSSHYYSQEIIILWLHWEVTATVFFLTSHQVTCIFNYITPKCDILYSSHYYSQETIIFWFHWEVTVTVFSFFCDESPGNVTMKSSCDSFMSVIWRALLSEYSTRVQQLISCNVNCHKAMILVTT